MIDWTDSSDADPISDMMAARDIILSQRGLKPTTMFMSSSVVEVYEWCLRRDEMLNDLLERTNKREFVQRYVLRRMLGHSRRRIIAPRLDRFIKRKQMDFTLWRHRNDPDWM